MNNNHTRRVREDAELEKTYKSMTSKGKYAKPGRPTGSRALTVIAICVAAVILVSCVLLVACGPMGVPDNAVLRQDITVAGVSVGGMTVKDAENAVAAATEGTYTAEDMVVTVSDTTIRISPATAGITFDVRAAVEAAYLYGQDHPDSDGIHEMDILPYLQVKEAAVREALAPFDEAYNVDASESRYEVLGDMPALTPPETEEDTEDEDALPDVTCQTLVLHKGTPKYFLDMDALYQQVLSAYNTNQFQVEAEPTLTDPDAMDLDAIHEQLHLDPVDAVMDPETFEVTPETYGYTFDLEAAKAAFRALAHGESTELEFTLVAPEVPAKELEALLFRDVLSSYTAYQSSSYARATNLNLACQAVNGTILYPGDVFSYNGTLGKRTAEKGYMGAAAYVGSETVTTIGGGICQVSSTIYYCTLVADLDILERDCHRFASSYVPLGMDATVNWGTLDLKFRNSTNYPIRIEAYADGGSTTVRLVGTDDRDYYVKPEYVWLDTYPYTTSYEVMAPDNEKGYKDGDVIVSPYTGYLVSTYLNKYDKETDALIEREYVDDSSYSSRDKVICKIEDPNAGGDTGNTGGDTGNTGGDTGNTGGDTGNTGGDTGNTGGDTGNTGGDTGNTGGDTGNTGGDTGNTGGDTGNTGGDTGNTGGDTGDTGDTGGSGGGISEAV